MTRLLVAVALVCTLSYVLYPQEFRVVAGRLEEGARSAAASMRGAVRSVMPDDEPPPPPLEPPRRAGARAAR